MKKILLYLGLVRKSEFLNTVKEFETLNLTLEKELKDLKSLFSRPEPSMSYDDFVLKEGLENDFGTKHWNEYWSSCYQARYISYYIRKISMNPDLLNALLLSISEFSWDECLKNYNEQNWTWNDRKRTPTKLEMIDCVVDLAYSLSNETGECSSGGFTVNWDGQKVLISNETIKSKI